MRALIVYASTHGHNAKIAGRVREVLEAERLAVDAAEAHELADARPEGYDLVVVGASIHAGHHQRQVVDWVRRHADALNTRPSAFFSVSLTPADGTDEAWATARGWVDAFIAETGWTPDRTATFAGALQYREYGFFTRVLIKRMMRRGGHPTDTSRDYDYTDWNAVERFARDCAALPTRPASSAATMTVPPTRA